ncbi:MAG: hypothetical protein ACP6IS_11635 [Candidatus Asgardarchaeia archaeon]
MPRKRGIKIKRPGSLKKIGYDPDHSKHARHIALGKAVKRYGYGTTVRKLNAIRVLTKRRDRKHSRIYEQDLKWLQKKYKKQ